MSLAEDDGILKDRPSRWQYAAPALTLALLAPVIGEVLTGATRLSFIFVLIPEIMVWGCGALLIREAVRRWRGGGTSLVLMGLALAVAEEWVIQQTSLSPFAWPGALKTYGRVWGVNWIWFLIMLGYECVWVTLVPVQVTELIFWKRRKERWLSNGGFAATAVIFIVGSFIAWFLWTHIARPKTFHVPVYRPPASQLMLGALIIMTLILAAYVLRGVGTSERSGRWTLPLWATCLSALVFTVPWFGLMAFVFGGRTPSLWIPLAAGCAWAIMVWSVIGYWVTLAGWDSKHRWALVFGATVGSMLCGFSGSASWSISDLVGKVVLNVLAVLGFVLLAHRLHRATQII